MITTEYTGTCEHLNQELVDADYDTGDITTCLDCGSVLNELEGIWYE